MFVIRSVSKGFLGDSQWVGSLDKALKFLPSEKNRAMQMAWRAGQPEAEFVSYDACKPNAEPYTEAMIPQECYWLNRG
jgi:hypothetical protein